MSNPNLVCAICLEKQANYKCPKCGVRYCSLACYKNPEKHVHDESIKDATTKSEVTSTENNNNVIQREDQENKNRKLETKELNNIYETTPELQELLQYNTVKFHLHKVYRILTTDNSGELSSEGKKQLAIDYLNTLRYGGVHCNEAIEEFCQILTSKLENSESM